MPPPPPVTTATLPVRSISRLIWAGPSLLMSSPVAACEPVATIAGHMLHGARVVDRTTQIAGPYCTKLLADAGAGVVKVEDAGGDPLRRWRSGGLFEFLNTSKRSVIGADADLVDLAARADIVVA